MKNESSAGQRNINQFQTLNGKCLELYPIHLGTSYFRANVATYRESQLNAFTQNAFLLWLCRDVVFSDSRLFLSTVFAGNSVFPGSHFEDMYPTLGAVLEWWEKCDNAHIKPFDVDELMFVYHKGGPVAPKQCYSVNVLGNIGKRESSSFFENWRCQQKINKRYHTLRADYQSHSMEKVVRIIAKKCPNKMYIVEKWRRKVEVDYWLKQANEQSLQAEYYKDLYYTAIKQQLTDSTIC